MSDPYPVHPDHVQTYDPESLFHSNGNDYNREPAPINDYNREPELMNDHQHEEQNTNKEGYVSNDNIVRIAHSALQHELFENEAEEDDAENNMHNDHGFAAQDVTFGNNDNNNNVDNTVNGTEESNHRIETEEDNYKSYNTMNRMEENNLLWPVLPLDTGEGLPYAPIDWPQPGDVWNWRVGRRFNSAGFFQDRFLSLPRRLGRQTFASKNAVINYIKANFPGADIDAFFNSFAWKIPVKMQSPTKAEPVTALPPPPPPQEEKLAGEEEPQAEEFHPSGRKKRKVLVASYAPSKETETEENGGPVSSTPTPKRRRQSKPKLVSPSKAAKQSGGSKSSRRGRQNETTESSAPQRKTRQTGRKSSHPAPQEDVQEEPVIEPIPEDFDNYLSSLEDILAQPVSMGVPSTPMIYDSSGLQIEMLEARSKLSSLLVMDFTSLISPNYLAEVTTLASKLRKDPTLNAEQLVKLKLIEEMPSFSEVFLESRELIIQVDEFFANLEGKKAKVASLKSEYSELKEKVDHLQAQVDANSMAVDEIDRQIAILRSRRAELTSAIDSNKAAKTEVTNAQKMVASAIPKVVQEIQIANSKLPSLELKRRNAVKREAEIRSKFAALEGFSL